MEQFAKAVIAVVLAAVLAIIAIKAVSYIAKAAEETDLPLNIPLSDPEQRHKE